MYGFAGVHTALIATRFAAYQARLADMVCVIDHIPCPHLKIDA